MVGMYVVYLAIYYILTENDSVKILCMILHTHINAFYGYIVVNLIIATHRVQHRI